MNAADTARLCRILSSLAPAQHFDEDTPAVWHAVLADIRVNDAIEAVKELARTRAFIGAADICETVAALRRRRVEHAEGVDGLVPNVDPDDVRAFNAERRALIEAAADGTLDIPEYMAGGRTLTGVPPRRAAALLAGSDHPEITRSVRAIASAHTVPGMTGAEMAKWGGERPPAPEPVSPTVDVARAAELEAERARQLDVLAAMSGETS